MESVSLIGRGRHHSEAVVKLQAKRGLELGKKFQQQHIERRRAEDAIVNAPPSKRQHCGVHSRERIAEDQRDADEANEGSLVEPCLRRCSKALDIDMVNEPGCKNRKLNSEAAEGEESQLALFTTPRWDVSLGRPHSRSTQGSKTGVVECEESQPALFTIPGWYIFLGRTHSCSTQGSKTGTVEGKESQPAFFTTPGWDISWQS